MKYHFILLLFILTTFNSLAQDISIVVYKGDVFFLNRPNPLQLKTKYEISPKTTIQYNVNSEFAIFSKTKLYKRTYKEAANQTYKDILANLNINAPRDFWELMGSYHSYSEIQNDAKGSGFGAGDGLNDRKDAELMSKDENIYPADSSKTSSKSIELNWKLKNSIMNGRLYVIHQSTKDTIYNQPATNIGKVIISLEKLGNYDWYIYSKTEKKNRINQSFIKLSEEEGNKMKSDFEDFKKAITLLEDGLQAILIEEYKLKFGIID